MVQQLEVREEHTMIATIFWPFRNYSDNKDFVRLLIFVVAKSARLK
jgi:hypothetical protein